MMSSVGNLWTSAEYWSFSLDAETNFYAIHVSGYSGDAGDAFASTNSGQRQSGMKFSTMDKDNDLMPGSSCSRMQGNGGWWFSNCGEALLNTDLPNYVVWNSTKCKIITRMMIRLVS